MRIAFEGQKICNKNFRGIPVYSAELLTHLVRRDNYDYDVYFFDYLKERGNRETLRKRIPGDIYDNVRLYECNTESFQTIMDRCLVGTEKMQEKSILDYFPLESEIFHFVSSLALGLKMPERSIVTVHDMIPILFPECSPQKEQVQFRNSFEVLKEREDVQLIAVSYSTKKDLINCGNIGEERIAVAHLSYDREVSFPETSNVTLEKHGIRQPYVLYLGALDPRKGIQEIIEAYCMIADRHKDLMLVLAGGKALHFQEETLEIDEKYRDRVILTGYVTDDEKRHLMSSAEAFLFPSIYEGFGLPVLEAMACGCPVITTEVSSLPEVGGDAVLYVPVKRADVLAERMEELLDSSSLKERCVARGLEQCRKFTWDETARLTEQVYQKFI